MLLNTTIHEKLSTLGKLLKGHLRLLRFDLFGLFLLLIGDDIDLEVSLFESILL